MSMSIVAGLLIPFLGTTAGAACVFFLKKQIGGNIQRIFTGFAAGVMVAASVWSLLIPAMDMCEEMGKACISSRNDRLFDRYCFFVVHR